MFEGGEGSGKSTQAQLLGERLGAVVTHEPGATALGARLRQMLLDPATAGLDARTEALLMAADRAQHVRDIIRPALAAGRDVICDRFVGSSIAYQGHGRGLGAADVAALSAFAVDGVMPHLVILLDVAPSTAARRSSGRLDRVEAAGDAFHARVRAGYLGQAEADPARWAVVDGAPPVGDVAMTVARLVHERLDRVAR